MRDEFRPISINFAHVDVIGWPGLALVLVAIAIALEFPQSRWLLLAGVVAGALLAAVLIVVRRRRV